MSAILRNAIRDLSVVIATSIALQSAVAETLTGADALQLLVGRSFKLKCSDGLSGSVQFDDRGLARATFKHAMDSVNDPERRATAESRVRSKEICFTIEGLKIAGEICAPVRERSAGNYRFGTNQEWCDLQILRRPPSNSQSVQR